MNDNPEESDYGQLLRVLGLLNNGTSDQEILSSSLEVIEDLCHQIDNGVDFIGIEGAVTTLLSYVDSVDTELSRGASRALQAIVSNNKAAATGVTDQDAIPRVVSMLRATLEGWDGKPSEGRTSSAIFFLSSLIRTSSTAAEQFASSGGMDVSLSILRKTAPGGENPLALKVGNLMLDLWRPSIPEDPSDTAFRVDASLVDFPAWCHLLAQHITASGKLSAEPLITLLSLWTEHDTCVSALPSSTEFTETVRRFTEQYETDSANEEPMPDYEAWASRILSTLEGIRKTLVGPSGAKQDL